jgi:hypothetical protein
MTNGPGTESRLTNISQYHSKITVSSRRILLSDIRRLPVPCAVSILKYTGLDIHAGIHPGARCIKKGRTVNCAAF